jgi:arylsulfatase B
MNSFHRPTRTSGALTLALVMLGIAPAVRAVSTGAPPTAQTNVVLIVLDDLGSEKLCFNSPMTCGTAGGVTYADIPNLRDRIAGQGIRYTRAYASPTCSPTRANILTAKYGFRTGVISYIQSPSYGNGCAATPTDANLSFALQVDPTSPSLPQAMKNRGYATGAFGKWHLNYVDPCVTATNEGLHVTQHGFDEFVGHIGNNDVYDNTTYFGHFNWLRFDVQGTTFTPPYNEAQWDARVARQAAQTFIQGQAGGPHFTYVAFNPPHATVQMPHFEQWTGGTQRPLNISQRTWDMLLRNFSLFQLALKKPWPADGPCGGLPSADDYKGRLVEQANIEAVDWEIGQLLNTIEATDLAHGTQTAVIVIGDNGTPAFYVDSSAHPNLGPFPGPPYPPSRGKNTLYDLGINVPLLVRHPGVAGNAVCSGLVNAVDLYPTILQIAGDTATTVNDGLSLHGSILANGGPTLRSYAYSEKLNKNAWQWTGSSGWNDLGAIPPNGAPPNPAPQFDRCIVKASSGGDLYKYINYVHTIGVLCSPPSPVPTMCLPACPDSTTSFCPYPLPTNFTEEFYNLSTDPNEVCNLLCSPGYNCTLLTEMRTLMAGLSGP